MKHVNDFGGFWPEYCELCGRPLEGYTMKTETKDEQYIFLACDGGNPVRKFLNHLPILRDLFWHYEVLVGTEPVPVKYDAFTGERLR